MTDQWAAQAKANALWSKPEEQEAITTIQRLLQTQLSPQQAAEKIASVYEACIKRDEGTARMWDLWNIVYDAINHLGDPTSNLEWLVQMMISISKLPDVVNDKGEVITSSMNAQVFWRELPGFAFYFREVAMNVRPTAHLLRGNPITWGEQLTKYAHASTFAALYLRALDSNRQSPARDFASMRNHAQWTLTEALEVPTDDIQQVRRAELYVPAASRWMLLAGPILWRFCEQRANNDDGEMVVQRRWVGGDDGGELLWGGEDGFGVQRWGFWKRRFGEVGGLEGAEGVVRRLAREAEEVMGRIEAEEG